MIKKGLFIILAAALFVLIKASGIINFLFPDMF